MGNELASSFNECRFSDILRSNAANNSGTNTGDYIYSTSAAVPPAPAVVSVAVPNGGETWSAGSMQAIQWTTSNVMGNVRIELSRDGGSSFTEVLFASTSNDGSESWIVTGPATSAARVRISSVSNPGTADTSDADFTIVQDPGVVTVQISSGWNMISNPVTTADDSVRQLYPASDFPHAFGFNTTSGYFQSFRMVNGAGYWGKFSTSHTNVITGQERLLDSIAVQAGWNMIGSISCTVNTSAISTEPPLILASSFFGYNNGYFVASQFVPGKAYWVKVSQNGWVILDCGSTTTAASSERR